jgi:peptide/nickel transport system substrate-binding protein
MYSTLVSVDRRNGAVFGDLAESVETDGDLAVVFTLREEIRFHPNAQQLAGALTSADIKRDFTDRGVRGEYLFKDVVGAIEAPDPRRVILRLRGPFGLLFEFLSDPAQAGIRGRSAVPGLESSEGLDTGPLMIGSGPFIPATLDERGLVLVANSLYHRSRLPLLERITLRAFEDDTAQSQALANGTLDFARHSRATIDEAPAGESLQALARPGSGLIGLGLSLVPEKGGLAVSHVPQFQDQRVRRAVARSLDRQALVELAIGQPSGPVGPAFAADALPPDELAAHDVYRTDPGDARALLEAAGAVDLSFNLRTPDRSPERPIAEAIAETLRESGFDPRLQPHDSREWQRSFTAGDFQSTVFHIRELATPDLGLRLHTAEGIEAGYSLWGYSNPLYDAAVRDALGALAPAARAERSREAQRTLLEDVPAMFPIAAPNEAASLRAGIEGFEWDAYDFNRRWLAARWSVAGDA